MSTPLIDLSLAPLVPMVLDAFTHVAIGTYQYFRPIIPTLIYIFLLFSLTVYIVKQFIPKQFLSALKLNSDFIIQSDKPDPFKLAENILKPIMRGVIAISLLLPLNPKYIIQYGIDPFLQFGAIYTSHILGNEHDFTLQRYTPATAHSDTDYYSESSRYYLTAPLQEISKKNNEIIKSGVELAINGAITLKFLQVLTGLALVLAFFSSNLFMSLMFITAIFHFGMALILYPFKIVVYVIKPGNDDWANFLPVFSDIISALRKLILTMIMSAFVIIINIQLVRALFGPTEMERLRQITSNDLVSGFGAHEFTWLSAILTFMVMYEIFDLTQKKIASYGGESDQSIYKSATGTITTFGKNVAGLAKNFMKKPGGAK